MEPLEAMDDLEIQRKVESLAGKGTRVIDCEKSTNFQSEEILLVNGYPVTLHGEEGERIKKALIAGQVPPSQLLNDILMRAGILKAPVELETTVNTKSTTKTTELLTLRDKHGILVDERLKEVEEDNEYESKTTEVWTSENTGSLIPPESLKLVESLRVSQDDGIGGLGGQLERMTIPAKSTNTGHNYFSRHHELRPRQHERHESNSTSASMSSASSSSYSSSPSPRPSLFGTPCPSPDSPLYQHRKVSAANGSPSPLTNLRSNQQFLGHLAQHQDLAYNHALVYTGGVLVAGSLDGLIQHLVPTQTHYPQHSFVFAFVLCSRLYIRPHELLGRVFRLALATTHHSNNFVTAKDTAIISRVVSLLAEWSQLFPYDFRDERMMGHVRTITHKCVTLHPAIRKDVSALLSHLLAKLTALERYEDFLHRISADSPLSQPISSVSIAAVCSSPTVLAQQLTHIELERLSHIGPEEFVQAFTKDPEGKWKESKKTRNLESYVMWFNRLSFYVATEICKVEKKKLRVRVTEYWIETARECFNIGNFNSLMALVAGLNMSPVARLKKTWAKINRTQLSVLEHQMDPTSNFASYRATLKAAVWRAVGATDEREKIVIPFFSLLVKDLYFLNEGCTSKLPTGHINFEKFWQLAKQVTEVGAWQQVSCPFPKVQNFLNTLQTARILGETALCLASYDCEPAENSQEKERLKYLRQDSARKKKGSMQQGD